MQIPYFIGVWLSLVERYVRDVEAAGSNPVTPIFSLFYAVFKDYQRWKIYLSLLKVSQPMQ